LLERRCGLAAGLGVKNQDYRDSIFAGVNNLVEVIGAIKPITVEDYVAANRSQFETSGTPRR
jgi:NAD(P)H dehydrogenase (quinone)